MPAIARWSPSTSACRDTTSGAAGPSTTRCSPGSGRFPASPPPGLPVRCRSIRYGQTTAWYVGDFANSRDGTTRISTSVASDGFVAALGLRLEDGRDFTPADSAGAPPVMIVSRSVATRLWPGRSPLGQRARYGGAEGPQVTVVGVVDDARFAVIGELPGGHLYLPLRQHYRDWQTLVVVTTRGNPAAMLPRLERALASLDPALPVFGRMTMEEAVASGFSTSRTAATIAGFFGVLALLIASLGLYALVAGAVAERTREIGVRLALGCTPAGVLRLMMERGRPARRDRARHRPRRRVRRRARDGRAAVRPVARRSGDLRGWCR